MSKALVYFSHRSSSIGEYIFQVRFLTCLTHQQLLAFSSNKYVFTQAIGACVLFDMTSRHHQYYISEDVMSCHDAMVVTHARVPPNNGDMNSNSQKGNRQ